MKEDSQNSQWTDETYQEIVDSKDTSLQCSPVRKLILDNLLGYVPANEDAGKHTSNRQEYLSCHEVEHIKQ